MYIIAAQTNKESQQHTCMLALHADDTTSCIPQLYLQHIKVVAQGILT